jgi:hypothetical protein
LYEYFCQTPLATCGKFQQSRAYGIEFALSLGYGQ